MDEVEFRELMASLFTCAVSNCKVGGVLGLALFRLPKPSLLFYWQTLS